MQLLAQYISLLYLSISHFISLYYISLSLFLPLCFSLCLYVSHHCSRLLSLSLPIYLSLSPLSTPSPPSQTHNMVIFHQMTFSSTPQIDQFLLLIILLLPFPPLPHSLPPVPSPNPQPCLIQGLFSLV